MAPEEFDAIVNAQIRICNDLLVSKQKKYSTYDCLHNFRISAELQGISMQVALGGMLAKHTVSLFDMLQSDEYIDIERWEETITDHINYLLILRAIVEVAEENYQAIIEEMNKNNFIQNVVIEENANA